MDSLRESDVHYMVVGIANLHGRTDIIYLLIPGFHEAVAVTAGPGHTSNVKEYALGQIPKRT
jgi:hypothetical protein